MTRRKFVRLAGSAFVLANIPFAALAESAPGGRAARYGGITPNSDFYITSYASTPRVDVRSWKFRIKGLVAHPLELSYEAIRAMPPVREMLTLECIGNPPGGDSIGNAEWVGVALRPILDRARIDRRAEYVVMRGADGYATGLPVDELMRKENFLPYMMNGVALPPDHGYPLRIFIPGKYGMKQPKWLTELEFVDHQFLGYWERRGWSNSAWRKPNSGFFTPKAGRSGFFSFLSVAAEVKGPVDIVGWSLAGPSGIKRVEISTDAGTSWNQAEIIENRSPYVWTVWKYRFAPKATGNYLVKVRATDGNGVVQPSEDPRTGSGASAQARLPLVVTSV
jgi:DMSO/TMAO reductase YedYZ molybdopterin-dependent catalytic subunit